MVKRLFWFDSSELKKMSEMLSSENTKSLSDQIGKLESEKNEQLSNQKQQFEKRIARLQQEVAHVTQSTSYSNLTGQNCSDWPA